MKKSIFVLLIIAQVFFYSCGEDDKVAEKIAKIDVNVEVLRFDQEFAKTTAENLNTIKNKYPYLFPQQFSDSIWFAKIKDTIQLELNKEVQKVFPDFDKETEDLTSLFKHIKYYFPNFETPKVVTLTSDVRYASRVILADSLLLIGLDNYLGKDHKFYAGFQNYIATSLDKQFLVSDVASEFSAGVLPKQIGRTFIEQIIYYGKELYLKDKLLPFETEAQRIGYTPEQLEWAQVNEEQIWRYFVERELLYSTDKQLQPRFLDPAPFSKFQLELDSESPGRTGRYIGWQIVRAFMSNNEVTVQQMLNIPAEEIFKKSNYKPLR
ncbi:gliding motility lipoprotein GldB [Cellulophaga baltica]|uniref:gliding motility lipoprotein GldB n=1 Tax=Cellulophaga TaxID=104264 RepID=UPI001C065484|nr:MULTISPECIES: gliding motility lipoprotein GldB [Cellulophaga]MBU2995082.1 gliding motility lipoprotein GldB [Cellulophaga baltica]MDO6766477.1 gliding motility lipoprotein GldB [Cellulophaga sp. 1_MG-2023]